MLPVSNLIVASLLMPPSPVILLGSFRRHSLPPDLTASGLRRREPRGGIFRAERSTEPTQVTGRQTERRPPQALFERGSARVRGALENAQRGLTGERRREARKTPPRAYAGEATIRLSTPRGLAPA